MGRFLAAKAARGGDVVLVAVFRLAMMRGVSGGEDIGVVGEGDCALWRIRVRGATLALDFTVFN
jgi:hypothetical protein